MLLRTKLFGKTYEFPDLRVLMGKANDEKSGDRLAGLAAAGRPGARRGPPGAGGSAPVGPEGEPGGALRPGRGHPGQPRRP